MTPEPVSPAAPTSEAEVEVFDEEGALSRAFLLGRGFCCENGCKNCPYGFDKSADKKGEL